jgi:hypothetical protein
VASPVYFFPRVSRSAVIERNRLRMSFLAERGVSAAFAGITDVQAQTTCYDLPGRGPGGHSGLILQVMDNPAPVRIGYSETHQVWHERPAGCDCWVGIDTEYPPSPQELAIGAPRGYALELGDGQNWKIPIVRSVREERSQLPYDFVYGEHGQLETRRAESRLWELSAEGWNHWFDREQHPTISAEILLELCLETLALNYRVGKVEQNLLRLVNSSNWSRILELLLDVPLLEEYSQKKTDSTPDSPSASPGATD